jgi:UDP-N-acetylmuramoyl-L-alanyl-D-glutamate--2,6-diaminopimelate ligase
LKLKLNHNSFKYISDNSKDVEESAFLSTTKTKQYKDDAIKNGAKEIIDTKTLQQIKPLDIKIIGVSGTNGKTTVSAIVYSLLLDLGFKVALQGTRGFFVNDKMIKEKGLTTPSVLENYSNIYSAIEDGCDYFVMEVSSHAISQNRIDGIVFSLKVHTNITSDHLDYHKTLQNYVDTKNSFFEDESRKIINIDDKNVKFNYKNSYTYSLDSNSISRILAYSMNNGLSGVIKIFDETENFYSNLYAEFNLYNILAAITAVKILTDIKLKLICEVLENFEGVSGRLEVVSKNPLIVVDFAHTSDGMQKVYEAFKDKTIISVFGAGGDKDKTKRAVMGGFASMYSKYSYITNDNPRNENEQDIAEDIVKGFRKNNYEIVLDRKSAICKAIDNLSDKEVLLVLGKGDETTQEFANGNTIFFSDKKVITNHLQTK